MRSPFAAVIVAGLTISLDVLAQTTTQYSQACDPTSVSRSEAARAHTVFLSGKEYLDESNYEKAIRYFQDSYSIDCSVHGILRALASAYERKGDKAAAVEALQLYLQRASTAPDRDVVERRIKNLREQLERDAEAEKARTATPPPPHIEVAPRSPSSRPAQQPAKQTSGASIAPWILSGLGGSVAIAGSVLEAIGATDVSSASSACSTRVHCAFDVAAEGNRGRTLEQAAAVALPAGVAILVTGILWRILEGSHAETTTPPSSIVVRPDGYAGTAVDVAF
ncbi:MAG: tetratricopeptide repeat protein [Polyangiaceae bacterium]|jgi:tetratricopeptide (TPR) repeat protein